ncbi:MAG: hypothetical protein WAV67_01235, partial [Dokdonella sp.]
STARSIAALSAALWRMLPLLTVTHPPVPVGKYWTDQPLAGHAMDRVASAAAQDVPSAEPGKCLRTRTALPCGRQVIGSHLSPTFLCEEKGGSLAGRREKRLTRLAEAYEGARRSALTMGLASWR